VSLAVESWDEERFHPLLERRPNVCLDPEKIEAIGAADDPSRFRLDFTLPDEAGTEEDCPADFFLTDFCPADF
jgi:hypothetical protein